MTPTDSGGGFTPVLVTGTGTGPRVPQPVAVVLLRPVPTQTPTGQRSSEMTAAGGWLRAAPVVVA